MLLAFSITHQSAIDFRRAIPIENSIQWLPIKACQCLETFGKLSNPNKNTLVSERLVHKASREPELEER
jgi:hypothetical protein